MSLELGHVAWHDVINKITYKYNKQEFLENSGDTVTWKADKEKNGSGKLKDEFWNANNWDLDEIPE